MGDGRGDLQRVWHEWVGQTTSGKTILDVGAGIGLSKARLERDGANRVTTLDIERSMMGRVDLIADPRDLCGKWDVVTAFDVVEHVPDAEAFLRQLARLAVEAVIFTTPAWQAYPQPWHFRPEEVLALARLIGRPSRTAIRYKDGERDEILEVPEETFLSDARAYALGVAVEVKP